MGATGTATIDFGSFPGKSDAFVAITGQAAIVANSLIEAWIRPAATADHTADEHMVETLKVIAGNIVAGTGFTIYGFNTNQINEPMEPLRVAPFRTAAAPVYGYVVPSKGGMGTRLYGLFTVAWVWN